MRKFKVGTICNWTGYDGNKDVGSLHCDCPQQAKIINNSANECNGYDYAIYSEFDLTGLDTNPELKPWYVNHSELKKIN